jgi:hypothetical protein
MTIGMTLLSTMTVEQTLFSIGRTLAVQVPPRLDQLAEWHALFDRLGATRYDKYIIEIRVGEPSVIVRSLDSDAITRSLQEIS